MLAAFTAADKAKPGSATSRAKVNPRRDRATIEAAIRKAVQGLIDPSSAMIGNSLRGAAVELAGILRYTGLSRP
jgi:hypothetical protein